MDLILPPIELVTLFSSAAVFAYLSVDGETNWFESVQLLALYLFAAVGFFFLPGARIPASLRLECSRPVPGLAPSPTRRSCPKSRRPPLS